MAKSRKSAFGGTMFRKDPDVLPFFTIHPKTKVGSIIRGALSVFCVAALLITFLASRGVTLIWFYKFQFLLYIVPAVAAVALIALALFKRMKTTFTKIAVPGVLAFFTISVVMTIGSMMSYSADLSLSPKLMIENGDDTVVLMRTCYEPEGSVITENADGTQTAQFPRSIDAYRYTVRIPEAKEGVSYTIEGEILIPSDSSVEFEIKEEWVDDDTFRLYIAKDTSELGYGEITVKFTEGETTPESAPAPATTTFRREFSKGDHRIFFYREPAYIQGFVSSPMYMEEQDFRQVFFAFPRKAFVFFDSNAKVEGTIVVEPQGRLNSISWRWNEDKTVALLTPGIDCEGVSGEIIVWFEDNAEKPATWGEAIATASETTPIEATPAEADRAEGTESEASAGEAF